jgi:iron(III) transport system ATP-binding protein
MAELRIDGLTKAFGTTPILRGLTLSAASTRLVAVLGASGSGKTTLLRLICGFDRPESGTIAIGDVAVCGPGLHLRPEQRKIGYVAQEGALFPHLAVADNITFGLPWRQRRMRHRVSDLLTMVGLPHAFADRLPHQLSGGEQQRVALARALAPSPALVLLDEPFSALDAALRVETREAVARALRASGATALLVTHDQSEALSMADSVAVLRDGALIQLADPKTLYRRPVDAALARFLGEAVMLPGQSDGNYARCVFGTIPLAQTSISGPVQVLIRPEQIRLMPHGPGASATVTMVTYYGRECSVLLDAAEFEGRVAALVPGHAIPEIGQVVWLQVEGPVIVYPR